MLSGNIVILSSSLSENDSHIYSKINNSNLDTIYISAITKEYDSIYERAQNMFPDKNIVIFNAETISYEMPESET